MTRQRATVSEKKQRRAYVLRMIGEGWGLSELTTHVADLRDRLKRELALRALQS